MKRGSGGDSGHGELEAGELWQQCLERTCGVWRSGPSMSCGLEKSKIYQPRSWETTRPTAEPLARATKMPYQPTVTSIRPTTVGTGGAIKEWRDISRNVNTTSSVR